MSAIALGNFDCNNVYKEKGQKISDEELEIMAPHLKQLEQLGLVSVGAKKPKVKETVIDHAAAPVEKTKKDK